MRMRMSFGSFNCVCHRLFKHSIHAFELMATAASAKPPRWYSQKHQHKRENTRTNAHTLLLLLTNSDLIFNATMKILKTHFICSAGFLAWKCDIQLSYVSSIFIFSCNRRIFHVIRCREFEHVRFHYNMVGSKSALRRQSSVLIVNLNDVCGIERDCV